MYDYFLGGFHNFEIDRRAAEAAIAINPDTPLLMRANRAFLRRAVTFLVEQGIDQFLDIGAGIPTVGSVHEVAGALNPAARVVYVDVDPVAVRHSQAILQGNPNAIAIHGDARQPEQILSHPEARRLLDFDQPMAVLLVALLHFIPDEGDVEHLMSILRAGVAPGSYLVLSHGTYEGRPPELIEQGARLYARTTNPLTPRSRAQVQALFAGFDLVEPGLVYVPLWRPDETVDPFSDDPARSLIFAGVGRKQ
jgi:hypothetical protein